MTPFVPTTAPWLTISETGSEEWRVMQLRSVIRKHAKDGRTGEFTVADAPEWVNVIALTPNGDVICVEQFRHGINAPTLEIPGGVAHLGEDPIETAKRECREETGWASDGQVELLGVVDPNPAFMSNRCHVYVWRDCTFRGKQLLDPFEDIRVHLISMSDIRRLMMDGQIRHSLVLSAFALYNLHHDKLIHSATETSHHE